MRGLANRTSLLSGSAGAANPYQTSDNALILCLDAIWNTGVVGEGSETHDPTLTNWFDCVTGNACDKAGTSDIETREKSIYFNGSVGLKIGSTDIASALEGGKFSISTVGFPYNSNSAVFGSTRSGNYVEYGASNKKGFSVWGVTYPTGVIDRNANISQTIVVDGTEDYYAGDTLITTSALHANKYGVSPIGIGYSMFNGSFIRTEIRFLRMYNRALSQEEITLFNTLDVSRYGLT